MHRFVVLLVVSAALAGCAEDAEPAALVDDVEPVVDVPSHYAGAVDLLINPDTEAIGIGGTTRNCVMFWDTDGADYGILNGTATLTWNAGPTTELMRLRTTGAADEAMTDGGASPLTMDLMDLATEPDGWGIAFWATYSVSDGTMPLGQSATMSFDFDYEGALPEPRLGSCTGGGV